MNNNFHENKKAQTKEPLNNTITISMVYSTAYNSNIELPEGITWKDIKDWKIEWDNFYYTIDGENYESIELDSDNQNDIDWEKPINTTIYDEEGEEII